MALPLAWVCASHQCLYEKMGRQEQGSMKESTRIATYHSHQSSYHHWNTCTHAVLLFRGWPCDEADSACPWGISQGSSGPRSAPVIKESQKWLCVCVCRPVCMSMYVYMCFCGWCVCTCMCEMYTCMGVCAMPVLCICMCIYVYVCVYMYLCTCVFMYMYMAYV